MDKQSILKLAKENQAKAFQVIADSKVYEIWQGIGAEINLIGSLKTGLLMTHRDIDFHIYTDELKLNESFAAIQKLSENPRIKEISYRNLLEEEDSCLEWHAWYEDSDKQLWQLDMMHIRRGSKYDGFFEKTADRILAVMTPEQRETILKLKYVTPPELKIEGIKYYIAVIRDGIKDWPEFANWLSRHSHNKIYDWQP